MKNLWWAATDSDNLIIHDMKEYASGKNIKRRRWWWWCCCCRGKKEDCEIYFNKRSSKSLLVVSVASGSGEIKEWLHYYALCAIATSYGAQVYLSV